jgi:hypothetical protein
MIVVDKNRFAKIMQYLGLHFPDREIDQNIVEAYFDAPADYDIGEIKKMAKLYVQRGGSFPFVCDPFNHLHT